MNAPDSKQPAFVVVAPTYNNAGTLGDVVRRILATGLPLIVVNDGCTDGSAAVLEALLQEHADAGLARLTVRTHVKNRGKAAALHTGFEAAQSLGYTHAITIDTDGQHDPEQIPLLLAASQAEPRALVIGSRGASQTDAPARSLVGRRISNFLVWIECGHSVLDSQSGFRVYPLSLVRATRCTAERFAFETEVITRAVWAGAKVIETPIVSRYFAPPLRVSHFDPWLDTLRGLRMHLALLGRAMWPWRHRELWEVSTPEMPTLIVPRLLHWLSFRRAWEEIRSNPQQHNRTALAAAMGVFVANMPVYPFQTVLCLVIARRFKLNPIVAVAGSQASTPPMNLVLIVAAIATGHLMLHGQWPAWPHWPATGELRPLIENLLVEWVVGSLVVGPLMALASFGLLLLLLRWMLPASRMGSATPQA